MRRAMAEAVVGDDTLGDDPTVRELEAEVAALLGKERALFFPSGVMANQTALAVQGRWGSEVVVEGGAHIFHFEEGAAAALKGLQLRAVHTDDGVLRPEHLDAAVRPVSPYLPRTSLVCVENTHLASGGRVVSPEDLDALGRAAAARGLPVHMDGARLWHAAAATGRDTVDFTRSVDTVMVCLSKGLGAPVGSMLAGPADVMDEAWRVRRRFGGGLRQSGVLAAAGLYALREHRSGLSDDHRRARELAAALDAVPGISALNPETNVVMADLDPEVVSTGDFLGFLESHRILMLEFGPGRVRGVLHRDVDSSRMSRLLQVLSECARSGFPA
ncbi:MAG: aminotransferase class I/II-fold pyridoxal phosphate-dependent enzyme [Gemmatimonadetes bacterium]|nr:aminotransferase class I/II-fold pyridoxal phosphate-dependent enzyme [Gemmatimonadota bacterium]NNK61800.1 aminotransferase class I/II-fold pyridoxal phosphate-dependent enzyme [Gemmatimonadota bacterium]